MSNNVWTVFEERERFAEKQEDKDWRQWLLEGTAFGCYSAITANHWRRLYEELKFGEGHGDQESERRLGRAGKAQLLYMPIAR